MFRFIRLSLAALCMALSSNAFAVEANTLEKEFCQSESALGNLITDAMRISSGADIALLACNVPHAIIDVATKSNLNAQEIELIFGNKPIPFHVVQMTGDQLLVELENEFGNLPAASDRFHQFSGIRLALDLSKQPGNRIVKITIGGAALDLLKTYTVAIPSGKESQLNNLQDALTSEIKKSGMMRARTYGRLKFVE